MGARADGLSLLIATRGGGLDIRPRVCYDRTINDERKQMDKNPNNPNCSCDELDEDILDEDGYTCYSCYEGKFDKVGG